MRVAIRSALLALPVSTLALASAVAADLPTRKPAPAYTPAPPIFTWTGFYVGVQGGWSGGGSNKVNFASPAFGGAGSVSGWRPDGGFLGLRAGYDYQFPASPFVLGVVADLNYDWMKKSTAGVVGPVAYFGSSRIDWDGSLRLKAGYAIDRFMIYATGGVAFANEKFRFGTTLPVASFISESDTRVGWTIGGGLQYAVTNNLIAGLEYRYAQFDRKTYSGAVVPAGIVTASSRPDFHRVAATLDWKF